jgi:hypothetical protein
VAKDISRLSALRPPLDLDERESEEPTRAQQRAAGTKKTARRRQGYGGLAYLPAEASAKAGALFDIVNRKRAPIGMGAEPTREHVQIVG